MVAGVCRHLLSITLHMQRNLPGGSITRVTFGDFSAGFYHAFLSHNQQKKYLMSGCLGVVCGLC